MVLEKTHQEYATYFIRSYTTFKHNSLNLLLNGMDILISMIESYQNFGQHLLQRMFF